MPPADEVEISVRQLRAGDAVAYRAFRLEALRRTPSAFTSSYGEELAMPLSAWVARLSSDIVLGAFDAAGVLVGTAGLFVPARQQERHKGTLFGMAVAGCLGGRGIGRQLVQGVLAEARLRDLLQIGLTVSAGNYAAEHLYRSCGFQVWGSEPRAVIVDGIAITKIHMMRALDD
ncbi:GNAT family N-acetyltransferase [Kribbella sp. NPDC051587]|uniref:GNAT family N-acetyltransferase n=1 Tax=Kribbella sp. NPDC051587 TaxID=3364119 RepID=UPI0037B10C14